MLWKGFFRVLVVMLNFLCLLSPAWSQQSGQTTGTATAGGTASSTTTSSADANNRQRSGTGTGSTQTNRRQGILFITGSVVLEDGSRPPAGAVIERVCGGQVYKESNVAPDGSFSFQIGGGGFVIPDAADSGQPKIGDMSGVFAPVASPSTPWLPMRIADCDLRAQLGGYRSSSLALDARQTMGTLDVGTLVLYPAARVQGTSVSVTSLAAPKNARASLQKGMKALQKKRYDQAETNLQTAVKSYPSYAEAWFRLGQVRMMTNRTDDARTAFRQAMREDAKLVGPYVELARIAAIERNWQEAAGLTETALKLNPLDFPYGYYLDGLSNYYLNKLERAETSARMMERLDSRHRYPETFILLANICRRKHDAAGETGQLLNYLKYASPAADTAQIRLRLQRLVGSH